MGLLGVMFVFVLSMMSCNALRATKPGLKGVSSKRSDLTVSGDEDLSK